MPFQGLFFAGLRSVKGLAKFTELRQAAEEKADEVGNSQPLDEFNKRFYKLAEFQLQRETLSKLQQEVNDDIQANSNAK